MTKNIKYLRQKSQKLEISAKFHESIIKEMQTTHKNSLKKIKDYRKVFHEEIDKYFDAIEERIEIAYGTGLATIEGQTQAVTEGMKACVDLASQMDNTVAETDSALLAQGQQLLSQANKLSQSLAGPSIDTVEIPQVGLERGQDWSLEGAVDLQLRTIQCRPRVNKYHIAPVVYLRTGRHISHFP